MDLRLEGLPSAPSGAPYLCAPIAPCWATQFLEEPDGLKVFISPADVMRRSRILSIGEYLDKESELRPLRRATRFQGGVNNRIPIAGVQRGWRGNHFMPKK